VTSSDFANLADGRGRTVSELGTAVGARPTTLTSVLDRLERRGHITRGSRPGDRRAVLVEITASGRLAAATIRQAVTELERGVPAAIGLVGDGIQRTARYAGAPRKYHATVSRAWVELVGHHVAEGGDSDFAAFADRNPALLDKRLLTRFYRPATLAGSAARTGWVEPTSPGFRGRTG
jgi:DNA-binding Lrp family transcriptional regulator